MSVHDKFNAFVLKEEEQNAIEKNKNIKKKPAGDG